MAMSVLAQAHLQRQLIFALAEAPAETTVEAARRVDASRTSASRSLNTLRGRGLVEKQGRTWSITEAGREAVAHYLGEVPSAGSIPLADVPPRLRRAMGLDAAASMYSALGSAARTYSQLSSIGRDIGGHSAILDMAKRIEDDRRLATAFTALPAVASGVQAGDFGLANLQSGTLASAFDVGSPSRIAALDPSLRIDWGVNEAQSALSELSGRLTALATYPNSFESVTKVLNEALERPSILAAAALLEPSIHIQESVRAASDAIRLGAAGALGGALTEAMAAQRMQLDALSVASNARAWWAPLIADTLQPTARIVGDLAAMEGQLGSRRALVRRMGAPLSIASAALVASHRRHLTESLARLAVSPVEDAEGEAQMLLVPTMGTASYVHGARRLLDPPPTRRTELDIDADAKTLELAERLADIDPLLREMLLGAWERIRDGGHDWPRQAAQSAREVLTQTLTRLAPNAAPDPTADDKVTHASKVRHILSKSRTMANVAEAQVKAVDTAYRFLVAEAHEHDASRVNRDGMAGILRGVESVLWIVVSVQTTATDVDS